MADLSRVIPELADRIRGMQADAAKQGLGVTITCGFRPLVDQVRLYKVHQADPAHTPLAAVPGTSNHGKVVNGKQQDATAVDLGIDDPTPANKAAHLVLAKKWGLFRAVPGEWWHLELDPARKPFSAPTSPIQPTNQEIDGMSDAMVITYPDGSKTIADPSGAVFNADTPHYGSMFSLKPNEKLGVESIKAATAVNPNGAKAGYRLWSQVGKPYQFDAEFAKNPGI